MLEDAGKPRERESGKAIVRGNHWFSGRRCRIIVQSSIIKSAHCASNVEFVR